MSHNKERKSMRISVPGVTLIEVMIVLVIISLLAGIGIPTYMGYKKRAELGTTQASLRAVSAAIEEYEATIGKFPEKLEDLVKRPSDPEAAEKWPGSLLKGGKLPKDAWGKSFTYRPMPDSEPPFELYSKGKDGKSKITA